MSPPRRAQGARPYDVRHLERSNRHLAGGRLRPLRAVLLRRELIRRAGRPTHRRPLRWREWWPPVATNAIPRNGHADRRSIHLRAALARLRRA